MELTEYQLLYVKTAYDYFRENLRWPTFRQVQRKIIPTHSDFRVIDVAKSIEDNQATYFPSNLTSSATITLREIHRIPEAEQDLADLLKVIRYSVKKYITEDTEGVRVTSEEISQKFQFDETTIRKIFQLLGLTTGIIGSSNNSLDYTTWSFEVSDSAIDFQDLQSIDDYFERREKIIKASLASGSPQYTDPLMSQEYDTPVFVMKERIAQEVIDAISDPKIKQICLELNTTSDQNVLSLMQSLGEALQWTLWYRGYCVLKVGMKIKQLRDISLDTLLGEATDRSKPFYADVAVTRFLNEFHKNFMKAQYDMVRHDPTYIPNIRVINPAIDALEHILRVTFPI